MVTITDPRPVLRQELSRVFKNQRVIRAFEKIFDLIPPEFVDQQVQIDTLNLISELAAAESNEATAAISRLASAIDQLSTGPMSVDDAALRRVSELEPAPSGFIANPYPHLEQGDWTPADASGAGLVITVNSTRVLKHEDLVIASCRIAYPVTASGANASLSGLPFTVENLEASRQGFISYSSSAVSLFLLPTANSKQINFFVNPGGAAATNAQLSGATLIFTVIYSVLK
jgi:hypothetical protein